MLGQTFRGAELATRSRVASVAALDCPQTPYPMEACHAHQPILPTDKRNPCFGLYLSGNRLSTNVFYGPELLEVVPDDPEHPACKMMVGRLANAKVRLATLEDVFEVDRKTIRSWGKAMLSRDPDQLARVLLGRSVNQKPGHPPNHR